jgi:uncharacterized protein YlbG (UPF0298 family)
MILQDLQTTFSGIIMERSVSLQTLSMKKKNIIHTERVFGELVYSRLSQYMNMQCNQASLSSIFSELTRR